MKSIKKINQLKNIESFIQADYVKGYKYIDKAGELVNKFHQGNLPPKFLMNLEGLVISQPEQKIQDIKVSPVAFWAHFLSPDSLDQISQLFEKKLEIVTEILQPEGFSRLGWRNYFICEINKQEKDQIANRLLPSHDFDFKQLTFSTKLGLFENNFNINSAFKKNDKNSPAILLDVDTFIKYEKTVNTAKVKTDLKAIRETINSSQFLDTINLIIGNDQK